MYKPQVMNLYTPLEKNEAKTRKNVVLGFLYTLWRVLHPLLEGGAIEIMIMFPYSYF